MFEQGQFSIGEQVIVSAKNFLCELQGKVGMVAEKPRGIDGRIGGNTAYWIVFVPLGEMLEHGEIDAALIPASDLALHTCQQ